MTNRTDDFNRANSTTSLGTPSDAGSAWVPLTGTWGVISNLGYCPVSTSDAFAYLENSASDFEAQFTFQTLGGDNGLIFRIQDANNLWLAWHSSENRFYKRVAGSFIQTGAINGTAVSGDVVKISANGNTLEYWLNGSLAITVTDSFLNTQTKAGIRANTNTTSRIENFSITDLGGGGGAYTINADRGTFTLTGRAANLLRGNLLTAARGTFLLTGISATLKRGTVVTGGTGVFTLNGQSANLVYSGAGSKVIAADRGTFTLTGQALGLLTARRLTADRGVFTLTGQAAGLSRGRTLAANTGAYVLTGQAAGVRAARILAANTGVYTFTGQSVTLSAAEVMTLNSADLAAIQALIQTCCASMLRLWTNKMITDPVAGTWTIYADDDVTPMFSGPLYEDAAATQLYRGKGAEHRGANIL